MRILKYLFLLFLLSLVTLTIFVATKKGDYTVEKSTIINSPRTLVFNYVNDNKNWAEWNSWAVEDAGIKITNSANTIGNGSFYSWEGKEGSGNIQTIFTKQNDSIVQKMNYNGNDSDVYMRFKDTVGGTKITWKTTGKMSFSYKILTAFNNNLKSVISMMFEKSLANLDKKLNYEINTYSVKVNGLVNVPESFYLAQTFTSEISNIEKNSGIVFPKIINYCKKNNIILSGKPFIIYHTYDTINKLTKLSICIPIRDSIFTAPGSTILSNKTDAYQAVKTTFTGNYSHKNKALEKSKEYFATNYLSPETKFSHIEIYTNGATETKNPSKWITEIYIPVRPKVAYKKPLIIDPNIEEKTSEIITPTKTIPTKVATNKVTPASKAEKEIPSEF